MDKKEKHEGIRNSQFILSGQTFVNHKFHKWEVFPEDVKQTEDDKQSQYYNTKE